MPIDFDALEVILQDPFSFTVKLTITCDENGEIKAVIYQDGRLMHQVKAKSLKEALELMGKQCRKWLGEE